MVASRLAATLLTLLAMVATGAIQASALVTQPDTACVCPRRSVVEMDTPEATPQRDLLLLALADMQSRNPDDFTSYFSLARIHGSPATVYDGVTRGYGVLPCASRCSAAGTPGGQGSGYCWHNSVMFPLWHRPYLALFEQELVKTAKVLAAQYPADVRDVYMTAANQLRLPFWAWDDPSTSSNGIPAILTDVQRSVLKPTGVTANIANPLAAYKFQKTVGNHGVNSVTYRNQNLTQLQTNVKRAAAGWRSAVTAAFSNTLFANFASQGVGSRSIESPHGGVHNTMGGDMTTVAMAAFDPIFYMHHCNVDKLIAQWQALRPTAWMQTFNETIANFGVRTLAPSTGQSYYMDSTTPLWPFRSDDAGGFWTSDQARDIKAMGYTYPGVGTTAGCCAPPTATQRSAKPKLVVPEDPYKGSYRVILALEGLDASQCGPQSFTVYCYIQDRASKTRKYLPKNPFAGGKKDRSYAGSYEVFTLGHDVRVNGEIDVTDALLSLGYIKKSDAKRKPPKNLVKKYVLLIAVGVDGKTVERAVKVSKVTVKHGRYVDSLFVYDTS